MLHAFHVTCVAIESFYQIANAEKRGAIGAILFSDPDDVAREADVYPDSWWLPDTGMQRGSTFLGDGDPLTPGWPSTGS